MNTTRNNHQPKLAAILISLVLLPSLMAAQATPNNSSQLSKKELKTISATRSNSTAQARLAEYYRDKARELTAKAQDFSAQAHALAKQPALNESKMGIACNCENHYRYFAKLYSEEAQESEIPADHHEQLAKLYVANESGR